jgi:hypothetical protein
VISGAVAVVGFALGLRFKLPALLAATAGIASATIAVGIVRGWPVSLLFSRSASMIAVVQVAYLMGLGARAGYVGLCRCWRWRRSRDGL